MIDKLRENEQDMMKMQRRKTRRMNVWKMAESTKGDHDERNEGDYLGRKGGGVLCLCRVPVMVSLHTWHVHAGGHCQKTTKASIALPPPPNLHDPMTPSFARRCRSLQRTRRRNAAAGRTPLVATPTATATARGLAAGLWRLRHAERQTLNTAVHRHDVPLSSQHERKAKRCCNGKNTQCNSGVRSQYRNNGILEKIEACIELPYGSMEKATKWDHIYLNNLDSIFSSHDPCKLPHVHHARSTRRHTTILVLEAELEKSRAQITELEDEKRIMRKKLDRFLRKLAEDKVVWKSRMREKARYMIATLKEDIKMERKHRQKLEVANTKLMKEIVEAKLSAKQFAQSYEMERKARELMEEACEELTKEVEEDQAEVELLRNECLSMRQEMEEERRMLQMSEVWREERVQMKMSDAKIALEHKYSQLNRLQAEMETFLRSKDDGNNSALQEARMISDAAASSLVRFRDAKEFSPRNSHAAEEVDQVFEHFCRKESASGPLSSASNVQSVSPATDIFLEKLDANGSVDLENDSGWGSPHHNRQRDSCASAGTSDHSIARASNASLSNGKSWGGSGLTETHLSTSRGSGNNTALIRRLWRSAISESRKKYGSGRSGTTQTNTGWTPQSSDQRSSRSVIITPVLPVAEECSSSYSAKPQRSRGGMMRKQSLQEKLLEARMDDQKEKPCHSAKQNM